MQVSLLIVLGGWLILWAVVRGRLSRQDQDRRDHQKLLLSSMKDTQEVLRTLEHRLAKLERRLEALVDASVSKAPVAGSIVGDLPVASTVASVSAGSVKSSKHAGAQPGEVTRQKSSPGEGAVLRDPSFVEVRPSWLEIEGAAAAAAAAAASAAGSSIGQPSTSARDESAAPAQPPESMTRCRSTPPALPKQDVAPQALAVEPQTVSSEILPPEQAANPGILGPTAATESVPRRRSTPPALPKSVAAEDLSAESAAAYLAALSLEQQAETTSQRAQPTSTTSEQESPSDPLDS